MDGSRKRLLWRSLVCLVAVVLIWQIVTVNVADHFVAQAQRGNPGAIDAALSWDDTHSRALAMKGRQLLLAGREDDAETFLQRATAANPADARPLVYLAELRQRGGEIMLAKQMIETADRLMPVHSAVQRRIGLFWLREEQVERAIPHLSKALLGNRELRDELFPMLLAIAEDDELRSALSSIAVEEPQWWESFFRYAVTYAEDSATLRAIVQMREATDAVELSTYERDLFIARLRREGRVPEAYLLWVNGLTSDQLELLGYLFDGSFELPFSNSGFGWYVRPPENDGVRITRSRTYGIDGTQALRVSLEGRRVRFKHLWQNLFLAPGHYRLSGVARPDQLKARRGLQWQVQCSAGSSGVLGKSEEFEGSGDWREFDFPVEVPASCSGQVLRLLSLGKRDLDHELAGAIWFDRMRIERIRE